MTIDEHLQNLTEELRKLSDGHQLAFSAACCERALPAYDLFSKREQWGDHAILRACLDRIWSCSAGESFEQGTIEELEKCCEALIPHSDDFPSMLAGAAQEASMALLVALQQAQKPNVRDAQRVASFLLDTVYSYTLELRGLDQSDPQEIVSSDPLIRNELEKQAQDARSLAAQRELTAQFLESFRARAGESGYVSRAMLTDVNE